MFDVLDEVATLSPGELAAQAAAVDAGLCRLLALVGECERRLVRLDEGVSFAGWLAWRCSLAPGQAREFVRVGRRLGELPLVRAAFSRGELSFAKAAVLAGVAEPESERELLELAAVMTASQLARAVGAYRRLSREEAAAGQEREFLSCRWTDEGALTFRGRLAGEEGAVFLRGLEAGRDALWEQAGAGAGTAAADPPASGDEGPRRPSGAQALVAMADLALAAAAGGGERPERERFRVLVHVDAETLARDAAGRCELAGGAPLAAETVRRLGCDGTVAALLERDGEVLALGRRRRTISPGLRRALEARDRGCRFPGCANTRFLDGHHLRHWAQGGETSLENLLLLCRRHHRLVHERGYTVRLDPDGQPRFTNRYGVAVENVPRPPPAASAEALAGQHRRRGLRIDAGTTWTGTGDRMDLGLAVDAIVSAAG